MTNCSHCPVSGVCHGTGTRPHFCEWAATGEPGKLMMIRDMAAMPPVSFEPIPARTLPGLLARAATLADAVFVHVAAGMPMASPELAAARLAICDGCDQKLPGGTCSGCGCHLKTKASWLTSQCPKDKWPDTEKTEL